MDEMVNIDYNLIRDLEANLIFKRLMTKWIAL